MKVDVAILGGGAAGLMCAIESGNRGRRTLVIEHQEKIGKKILISGGGRCNFTNIHTSPANFISNNPDFCRSALVRYTPADIVTLIEKHGIAYYEKTLGQLFCRDSARQITTLLEKECAAVSAEILLSTTIHRVERNTRYHIFTSRGEIEADSLVIACGGLSIPKIGASALGYQLAEQFGHSIITPEPALVPLTWSQADLKLYSHLSGVSFPTIARCNDTEFSEKALFTHRGLSGPAILQISSYWSPGTPLLLNTLPTQNADVVLRSARQLGERAELATFLARYLPRRLVNSWQTTCNLRTRVAELSDRDISTISEELQCWKVIPQGTEGFAKAEVTRGGVDTREVSSKTFESQKASGLFFIGEVLDVTGQLGGFNFQWAWASAHAAGQYV
jgi:predicted Rossmann fold flavoprotein